MAGGMLSRRFEWRRRESRPLGGVRRWQVWRKGAAAVAALTALLLLRPTGAFAYNLEGWQEYWPNLTYGYQQDCDSSVPAGNQIPSWERSYVAHAANNWNSSTTPVRLDPASSCSMFITINGYTANDGYGGHTYCEDAVQVVDGSGNPVGNAWCFAVLIQLNVGSTGAQTSTPVYDVYLPAHEFGHSVGLSHTGVAGSLMTGPPYAGYDCQSESSCPTTPQSDDVNGVNHMYPNYTGNGDYNAACRVNTLAWNGAGGVLGTAPGSSISGPVPPGGPVVDDTLQSTHNTTTGGAYSVDQTSGKVGTPPPGVGQVTSPGPVCLAP